MKVHPIFALAVSDVLLSSLWFLGGSAWMAQLGRRELCFAISLLTIVSPKITSSLMLTKDNFMFIDSGVCHC